MGEDTERIVGKPEVSPGLASISRLVGGDFSYSISALALAI
jgi:hypothetical protein